MYREFKLNAGESAELLERGSGPADIESEARLAWQLRKQPSLFKARNKAPSVFVSAARTPGEVVQSLLTIFCYLVLMGSAIVFGGETLQRTPGVFQALGLGVLVIPAVLLSSAIWRFGALVGEGARDTIRTLIRFWPLTAVALIFLFGLVRASIG